MQRRNVLAGMAALSIIGRAKWARAAPNAHGLKAFIRTNWSRDPLSFGSYSYVAKGTGPAHYTALEKPVAGTLYFAGEATFCGFNSTVHAAFLSGQKVATRVMATKATNIAIIGAGMSGLSAAHALSKHARNVTIFEARDRIGGRVWTDNQLGFAADLGASWIHGVTGNPLTELADELVITRQQTRNDTQVRGGDGRAIDGPEVPKWLFGDAEIQVAYGADRDQIDPSGITETDGFDGHDVSFPGGYAQIFKGLDGDYKVEFSAQVNAIRYGEKGVRLSLRDGDGDGDFREFDCVIVTVPLGVLKAAAIDFDPPLPQAKMDAIEKMGMGLLDKLYLQFDRTFWDEDATWIGTPENGLPRGYFNQWFNLGRYINEPVIVALNGATPGLELAGQNDETLVKMALDTLKGAYP